MFDVIWTDHNRELVGERRARKELDKECHKREDNRSAPSSASTRSSSSNRSEKPFGFLGTIGRKKNTAISKIKSAATSGSRDLALTSQEKPDVPPLTPASSYQEEKQSPTGCNESQGQFPESCENTDRSSQGESIFSKWTDQTATSPSSLFGGSSADSGSKSHLVQSLGPSSYIHKTTEVVVEPRTPSSDLGRLISDVTITSGGVLDRPPTPVSPKELSASPPRLVRTANDSWKASSDGPPALASPVSFGRRTDVVLCTPKAQIRSDNWKPPDAWDCPPPSATPTSSIEDMVNYAQDDESTSMALDLAAMQREIKRMAAASPQTILSRLREEWGRSSDAALYKELEMEKKRWMLSALHNMDPPPAAGNRVALQNQRILALFETQATTSYLAAVYAGAPLYHMSPAPLSHKLFSNIRPMLFPTVPSSSFPVAPQFFSSAHSLNLPALVPSMGIPALLRNIHRVLVTGGVLHMTLIDPAPVRASLGPRMQAWLDERLLLNLQRHFRCMSPSQLFPGWLADAHLRGEGSTITTVKFPAMADSYTEDGGGSRSSKKDEHEFKTELRSQVGRMLWIEVWGQYVTADMWWWEDADIVDECCRLGTYWDFSMIEAVRQG